MAEKQARVITIIGERPAYDVAGWLIWNAPRPLSGSPDLPRIDYAEWVGDWYHGSWYAATNPADPEFGYRNRNNISLDGWLLHFISEEDAVKEALADYNKQYGEVEVRELISMVPADRLQGDLLQHFYDMHANDFTNVPVDR